MPVAAAVRASPPARPSGSRARTQPALALLRLVTRDQLRVEHAPHRLHPLSAQLGPLLTNLVRRTPAASSASALAVSARNACTSGCALEGGTSQGWEVGACVHSSCGSVRAPATAPAAAPPSCATSPRRRRGAAPRPSRRRACGPPPPGRPLPRERARAVGLHLPACGAQRYVRRRRCRNRIVVAGIGGGGARRERRLRRRRWRRPTASAAPCPAPPPVVQLDRRLHPTLQRADQRAQHPPPPSNASQS